MASLGTAALWFSACGVQEEPTRAGDEVPAYEGTLNPGAAIPRTNTGNVNPASVTPAASAAPNPAPPAETTSVSQLAPTPPSATSMTSAPAAAPAPTPPPAQPIAPPQPSGNADPATTQGGPSAGCGVSQGMPANPTLINDPNTILTFPTGYDGNRPFPLLFGFHGAGRTNTDMRMVDSRTPGSQLENNYVVAFLKSAGNAWDLATDFPRFEAALDQILAERCIDQGALFAMGHSSGAQFIVQLLGDNRARETRLAAVAPVSSSRFNNPNWDPIPTLLIHGLMDTQRPNDLNGAQDISQYMASNQCTGGTQPLNIGTCASIANGTNVNPGCVQYSGCAETTLFCNHDDPNYLDNGTPTNHGWPCFANQEIFTFFESAR